MRPVIQEGQKLFTGYIADPKSPTTPFKSFGAFKPVLVQNTTVVSDTVDEYRIPESVPVFDQLKIGACVLNSWCALLELLLGLEGKQVTPLSRLMVYYLCREVMKTIPQDSGTFPFLAADRLMKIGVVPESMWPYDSGLLSSKPMNDTLDLYSVADDNKITGAYRLDNPASVGDDMETSVLANHPIAFAVPISNAMLD